MSRLAESVERKGFRKWYEQQLLSSHAHMVLAFLGVIAMLGSMEAQRSAHGSLQALDVLLVIVCAAISAWALRRYVFLLLRAEQTANQANCPHCGEYGRFRVVGERGGDRLDVRCHKCSRQWLITTPR